MSDREEEDGATGPSGSGRLDGVRTDREIAADLRLRPERPRVTRLSRRVLMGLSAASAIVIAAALMFALWPHGPKREGEELLNTDNRNVADGLNGLPRDYAGVPRPVPQLGPPLPGDLGKSLLSAGAPAPGMPQPAVPDPEAQRLAQERQRLAQEMEAARTSKLFASEARAAVQPTSVSADAVPVAPNALSRSERVRAERERSQSEVSTKLAGWRERRREHDSAERSRPQARIPCRAG